MSRLRLCPPRDTQQHNIFQYKEIATCTHVFLRRIAIAPPLTAPYDGPYKVVARSGKLMKILVKGKVETVSLGRVKPAHMENPQGPPRPGSADTPTSNGTRVNTKKSTAVRSSKKSATVPKQIDVKVNLSNRDNTYVAPHSRAPAVSRANRNGGGLRTYSRIPLHLRLHLSTDQTVRKTQTNNPDSCPIRAYGSRHSCA